MQESRDIYVIRESSTKRVLGLLEEVLLMTDRVDECMLSFLHGVNEMLLGMASRQTCPA